MAMLGMEFERFLPFDREAERRLWEALPTAPGVYVIRHQSFGLAEQSIAYIGRATGSEGLRRRIHGYFHPGPTQWTNKRVLAQIDRLAGHDLAYRRASTPLEAVEWEWRLLTVFLKRYGSLPNYNRQAPPAPPTRLERIWRWRLNSPFPPLVMDRDDFVVARPDRPDDGWKRSSGEAPVLDEPEPMELLADEGDEELDLDDDSAVSEWLSEISTEAGDYDDDGAEIEPQDGE